MNKLFNIGLRPYQDSDKESLEIWRKEFNGPDSVLELPNGYKRNHGVETNVAVSAEGQIIGSLTGTSLIGLDPAIFNPTASETEKLQALFALCRSLEVSGARAGAIESYIAVPNDLLDYQKLIQKAGYVETAQNCKIYRRQLYPVAKKTDNV